MRRGDEVTEQLKVLLVTKGLDLGGLERVVVDLAIGLSERGIHVEVAVVNSERDRLIRPLIDAGVTVHRLDGSDLIGVGAARRLFGLTRSGSFDIVHVHGPLPSVMVRLAARGAAPAVITTSHTPWRALHAFTRWAWRATSRLDTVQVAVSSAAAASLPLSGRRDVAIIPHGVDPVRIAAARAAAAEEAAAPAGQKVTLVAVASHRDVKNYPNLLRGVRRALDLGADVRLVAIGDGPGLAAHIDLARELSIGHLVTFRSSSDDVLVEIATADVVVVASDHEGQPIVVAEALALGVPVVATAVGRVPEMVFESVGRVVAPGDVQALGAAIHEIAANDHLRAQLRSNCRDARVRTLADVIDAHVALYAGVLEC